MRHLQSFLVALDMLRLHKLRAFLTMLGVIIGVMSVTLIVMISGGFDEYLQTQFKKLGADTMFVFFDPGRRGRGQSTGGKKQLTIEDQKYIQDRVQSIDITSGMMTIGGQKVFRGDKEFPNPTIYASDQNFQELNRFKVIDGRAMSSEDVEQRENVCVIGEEIRDRLFPDGKAVGQLISTKGITLTVIGFIEKTDFMGVCTGRMLLLPLPTAQAKWMGGQRLDIIMLRAKKGVKIDDAMSQVWEALMIRTGNRPIFRLDSRESILKVFSGVVGGVGGLLAAIAALSLLVGGIGIMNIMLVSVTERTREIGLRKAVGAKRSSILGQFLVEAATISLIGGLIGMGTAWLIGQVGHAVTAKMNFPGAGGLAFPFPLTAALYAALFSAVIGMVFGLYPAMSASKLDPIVALRTE